MSALNSILAMFLSVWAVAPNFVNAQPPSGRAVKILQNHGIVKVMPLRGGPKYKTGFQSLIPTNYQRRIASRMPVNTKGMVSGQIFYKHQKVRIVKVKVDTSMGGNIGETIKLQNIGPVGLNMTGWKIQDFTNKGARPNKSFDLNGYNFNYKRRILDVDLTGSQVRLNNDGDNIKLIDNMGNVHDVFSYDKSQVVKDKWIDASKRNVRFLYK